MATLRTAGAIRQAEESGRMKALECRGSHGFFAGGLLLIGLACLAPRPAGAGNISLELSADARVQGSELTVAVTVRNKGDEAAHSVTPTLHFRRDTVTQEAHPLLRPGQSLEVTLKLPVPDLGTGRWPYRIMVGYTDANAYPLHALHVGTLTAGTPTPGKLGVLEAVADPLATSGSLRMRVKNLSPEPRQVIVGVFLPEGIESPTAVPLVELASWEEREVQVPLVNRAALPGSRYAVFATAEYDDGAVHQSVTVPTTLEIVAAQSIFERNRSTLWVVAGVLVLAWAALAIWWMAAGRRARPST
jgi:hypothetical protein